MALDPEVITFSDSVRQSKKRAVIAAFCSTANISASCEAAEIHRSTHYHWLEEDPEYKAAFEASWQQAGDHLEAVAVKRAVEGSDLLLIFLLKALKPEKYRERSEVKHTGTIGIAERIMERRRLRAITGPAEESNGTTQQC